MFLGAEPRGAGFIRRRRLAAAYEALAARPASTPAGTLPAGRLRTAEQQKVEILRALSRDARLIVMDEPSAALERHRDAPPARDRPLAGRGREDDLLVSHFLREVLELADTVTVLRDGQLVKTAATADETEDSLIEAMLGRPLTVDVPAEAPAGGSDAPVVLSVRDVSRAGRRAARRFELRAGEIVGLAGLVGAGRTELARAHLRRRARSVRARSSSDGGTPLGRSPRRSLRAGLAMIPESRKDEGLLFGRSVVENVTLSRLGAFSPPASSTRPRATRAAASARSLRRARRELLGARSARSRAATSRRCCSRGCCCASRGW